MEFKKIDDYSVLINERINKGKEKEGTLIRYDNNKFYIKFDLDNDPEEYSIDDFRNKTVEFADSEIENAVLLKIRLDDIDALDSVLFNEKAIQSLKDPEPFITAILEQWRLASESAMKVSDRRQSTNNLFITILTILISGILFSDSLFGNDTGKCFQITITIIVCILGELFCFEWKSQIEFYGKLNDIKYSAVREIEKYLPVYLFNVEDVYFYSENKNERSFSDKEKNIPLYFGMALGVISLVVILKAFGIFGNASSMSNSVDASTAVTATTEETAVPADDGTDANTAVGSVGVTSAISDEGATIP